MTHYDIAIIGGGINGTGIARDAAGRGLKVLLCEQNDLASGTSSYSSKLIHGGLRYLEYYEFRLVREALQEREKLLRIAPHLIKPLQFIIPHQKQMRPAWLIRLGLFMYDHLSHRNSLPRAQSINLTKHRSGSPLHPEFKKGFSYYDCFTDDARLVIANAKSARDSGATLLTRHRCTGLTTKEQNWLVQIENTANHTTKEITAKVVINAAGPWLNQIIDMVKMDTATRVKLVKGSHIIVPKLYQEQHAYILQLADKRIIFVIPYEHDFSLIGTTDVNFSGSPDAVSISQDEIKYLCEAVTQYFKKAIQSNDIVSHYSGVRALQDDGHDNPSAVTRDYKIDLITNSSAPFINIAGGKITTYRKLAEHVMELLTPILKLKQSAWTHTQPLSGGNIPHANLAEYIDALHSRFSWLPIAILQRYVNSYGVDCETFLLGCATIKAMGQHFGHGLYEREVDYLKQKEWAVTAADILWRRSKLGLYFNAEQIEHLHHFLQRQ